MAPFLSLSLFLLIHLITAIPQTYSGTFSGTFTGAIQINGGGSASPAVPAVCPADHPISCASVGAANYCCGSGTVCGWYGGGTVGCCASGQTCNNNGGYGGGYNSWQPTSTYYSSWQPTSSSYYYQQTTTVYNNGGAYAGGGGVTTVYAQQQTSSYYAQTTVQQQQQQQGGFCSTVTENGPGLPTTYDGGCGTILVVNDAAGGQWKSFWKGMAWLIVVHGAGWVLMLLR